MLFLKWKQILGFIAGFIKKKGYAPSIRDIAAGCGVSSPSIAQYRLDILEREGYIHRDRGISRSISLVQKVK
jgi:repressor LexA